MKEKITRRIEIIQLEEVRELKLKKIEESQWELLNSNRKANMRITGVSDEEMKKEADSLF